MLIPYGPKTRRLALGGRLRGSAMAAKPAASQADSASSNAIKKKWPSLGRVGLAYVSAASGQLPRFSRRETIVIVELAAQPLASQNWSVITRCGFRWHDQSVAEALVIALAMIMQNELVNPFAQPDVRLDQLLNRGIVWNRIQHPRRQRRRLREFVESRCVRYSLIPERV